MAETEEGIDFACIFRSFIAAKTLLSLSFAAKVGRHETETITVRAAPPLFDCSKGRNRMLVSFFHYFFLDSYRIL